MHVKELLNNKWTVVALLHCCCVVVNSSLSSHNHKQAILKLCSLLTFSY